MRPRCGSAHRAGLGRRGLERLHIVPEAVTRHVLFEVAPDRFDQVEVRVVAMHPGGRRPPVLLRPPVLHHRGEVLADIVHHHYQVPYRHVATTSSAPTVAANSGSSPTLKAAVREESAVFSLPTTDPLMLPPD